MGYCSSRYFMLTICVLQMVATVERQVFDFLGYLWIPILVNFFEIILIIFGFYGAFQYRPKYIIAYALWHLFWLSWNIFIICLYMDIGVLNHRQSKVLKLDPHSSSWWLHGPGCKDDFNISEPFPLTENVTDCYVDYRHVEIAQSGLQCVLALMGIVTGFWLSKVFMEEDDSSLRKKSKKKPPKHRTSLYSIEFSSQMESRGPDSDSADYDNDHLPSQISPKPMTPRRVKRRSVMQRGSSGRHSTGSRRHANARSSTRSSRRSAQNPVTRILEQQHKMQHYESPASSSPIEPLPAYYSNGPNNNFMPPPPINWKNNGHTNPTYQQSSTQSLNDPDDLEDLYNNRPASIRSSYSNFHGARPISYGAPPPPPPPHSYHNQATSQVPQKRVPPIPSRQNVRTNAFLNSGPPAYSFQGSNYLDSETTI